MKIEINLEKLKEGMKSRGISPIINNSEDLKTVLETLFTDDGFISGSVKVKIILFEENRVILSLHSDTPDRPNERLLCAARYIDNLIKEHK